MVAAACACLHVQLLRCRRWVEACKYIGGQLTSATRFCCTCRFVIADPAGGVGCAGTQGTWWNANLRIQTISLQQAQNVRTPVNEQAAVRQKSRCLM